MAGLFDDNFGLGDSEDLGFGDLNQDLGFDQGFDQDLELGSPPSDFAFDDFELPEEASASLFGSSDEFDFSTFGSAPPPVAPDGFVSFPTESEAGADPLFETDPTTFDLAGYLSQEQRVAYAAAKPRAEGLAGVLEEVGEELLPSGKNGLLRAIGIAGGGAAAGIAVNAGIFAGIASGVGTIPAVLAGLALISASMWGGKKVADLATDYDEKAKKYTTAKLRNTAGDYEEGGRAQYESDLGVINTWENEHEIERLQEKSFVAGAAGFGAEMLPYVAEFIGPISGASRTIGALLTDPKRAKHMYTAAKAMAASGAANSVDDAVLKLLSKVSGKKAAAGIADDLLPGLSKSMEKISGGSITADDALKFFKTYKPSPFMGNTLLRQLTTGGIHALATSPGNEMVALDEAAFAGTPSEGGAKAVARHTTEIMSEYLGAALFDPLMKRITGKYVAQFLNKSPTVAKFADSYKPLIGKATRAMQHMSDRLQLQAGLPEYWEESSKELMDSMLNINDSGHNDQSARVLESLTSFVPHNAEQFDLLAKLQVMPLASAAVFAATGGRTDTQQNYRKKNLEEHLFPFIYGDEGKGRAITSPQEFKAYVREFYDLLHSSAKEDLTLLARTPLGKHLPEQLRHAPGSLTEVWNDVVKRKDIGNLAEFAEYLKGIENSDADNGKAKALAALEDILSQMNRSAMEQAGLGVFNIVESQEEADSLREFIASGQVLRREGGLEDVTKPGQELTPTQSSVLRKYTTFQAEDTAALEQKLQDTSTEFNLDRARADEEGGADERTLNARVASDLGRFLSRSGNQKLSPREENNLHDTVLTLRNLRQNLTNKGLGGLKVHFMQSADVKAAAGYRGAVRAKAANHIDSDGMAHILIAPGAGTLDIAEEIHEINMKLSGFDPNIDTEAPREALGSIIKPLTEAGKNLADILKKEGAGKKYNRKAVLKAINDLISTYNNSSTKAKAGDRVSTTEVFEVLSSLLTIASAQPRLGDKREARLNLAMSDYVGTGLNKQLLQLFDAVNSDAELFGEVREALQGLVGTLVDSKDYSGKLREGLDSFLTGYTAPKKAAGVPASVGEVAKELARRDAADAEKVAPKAKEPKVEPKAKEPKVEPKAKEPKVEPKAKEPKVEPKVELPPEIKDEGEITGGWGDVTFSATPIKAPATPAEKQAMYWSKLFARDKRVFTFQRGRWAADNLIDKINRLPAAVTELRKSYDEIGLRTNPEGWDPMPEAAQAVAREGLMATFYFEAGTNPNEVDDHVLQTHILRAMSAKSSESEQLVFDNGDVAASKVDEDEAGFSIGDKDQTGVDEEHQAPEASWEDEAPRDWAGTEGEFRALQTMNDLFSNLGLSGDMNRRKLFKIFNDNQLARIATVDEDAYQNYLFSVQEDASEAAFVDVLKLNDVSLSVFRDIVTLMNSSDIPGVDEFNFRSEKFTETVPDNVTPIAPRLASSLVGTVRKNLFRFTKSFDLAQDFLDLYLAAYSQTRVLKAKSKSGAKTIGLINQGLKEIGTWADPAYDLMASVLSMTPAELRELDGAHFAKQLEDGGTTDPPILRMFNYDLAFAFTKPTVSGEKFTPPFVMVKGVLSANPAAKEVANRPHFVRAIQHNLGAEFKIGANTQKYEAKSTSGSIGSTLEQVVRLMVTTENPLSFRKRSGGRQNNLLLNSMLFSIATEKGWEGLSQLAGAGRTASGTMTASNLQADATADVDSFHPEDLFRMLEAEFNFAEEGETYKAWLGVFGDKKQIWRIDRTRLSHADAIKEVQKHFDRMGVEVNHPIFNFIPALTDLKTAYQANHALVTLETTLDMYGEKALDGSAFKDSVALGKRKGSAVSTGASMLPELWERLSGRKTINSVTITDPTLVPEFFKTLVKYGTRKGAHPEMKELAAFAEKALAGGEDIADGFALVLDESMGWMQEAFGETLTKTGEGSKTPTLNILKSIVTTDQYLFKQSAGRLNKEMAEAAGGVMEMLYDLTEQHKKNGGAPIDILFFSSGSKRDDVRGEPIFAEGLADTVALRPDVANRKSTFTFNSDFSQEIPVEGLRWQLNAQAPNETHRAPVPRQLLPVQAEFSEVLHSYLAAVSSQMSSTASELGQEGAMAPEAWANPDWYSLLDIVASGDATLDPLNRVAGEEQLAKFVSKKMKFQTGIHHAVEHPVAADNGHLREYMPRFKVAGEWVDGTENQDPRDPGAKMAYSHMEANVKGARHNNPIQGTFDRALNHIRKDWATHLDMFVDPHAVTADNVDTQEIREWEIYKDGKGSWVVPGEAMVVFRVPADNVYSTAIVRVSGPVIMGDKKKVGAGAFPNVVRTTLSVQIATGSDFDVDKRFLMPFARKKEGGLDMSAPFSSVLVSMMNVYANADNYVRIAAPLDNEAVKDHLQVVQDRAGVKRSELEGRKLTVSETRLARRLQIIAGGGSLRMGMPREAIILHNSNQVGRRGLGFVASLAYGLNILNENQARLDSTKFAGFTFEDPVTGDPRTVEAGRTSFGGTENYKTTTKKIFGVFLNLFADHGKLQLIDKFGITDQNVPLAMAMMFAKGGFANETEAFEYLRNVITPALLTPEAEEWHRLKGLKDQMGATNEDAKKVISREAMRASWELEVAKAAGRPADKNFLALFDMAADLQKVNRLLRTQFNDLSDIHEYSRAYDDFFELAESGSVGAWSVSDTFESGGTYGLQAVLPTPFDATRTMLEVLEQLVYADSLRTSPVWRDIHAALFSEVNYRSFTGEIKVKAPEFSRSAERVRAVNEMLSQIVAVKALSKLWKKGKWEGSLQASLEGYLSSTFETYLMDPANVGNAFLETVQAAQEPATRFVTKVNEQTEQKTIVPTVRRIGESGKLVTRPTVSVLTMLNSETFSEAEVARIQAGFETLPPEMKTALTLYAVMRYGLDAKTYRGSYLQFISPEYRKDIHPEIKAVEAQLLDSQWDSEELIDALRFIDPKLRQYRNKNDSWAAKLLVYDPGFSSETASEKNRTAAIAAKLPSNLRDGEYTKESVPASARTVEAVEPTPEKPGGLTFSATPREFAAESLEQMRFSHFLSPVELARYDEAASTPSSLRDAIAKAMYAVSQTTGESRGKLNTRLEPTKKAAETLEKGFKGTKEELQGAIDRLLAPYYARYSPLKPLVSRYFDSFERKAELRAVRKRFRKEAGVLTAYRKGLEKKGTLDPRQRPLFEAEEQYLKDALEGTIEPYFSDPHDEQTYRERLSDSLGPAAKEFNDILDGKSAPNLADNSFELNMSAHAAVGLGKLIGEADPSTTSQRAKILLLKATRGGALGAFLAGMSAQKVRRKAGATKQGYLRGAKKNLGDKLLEAVTVLLEAGIEVEGRSMAAVLAEVRAEGLEIFSEVEEVPLSEKVDTTREIEYRLKSTEPVADILEQFEAQKGKEGKTAEIMVDVAEFFESARVRANADRSEEEQIPEFRLGQARYLPHLYSRDLSPTSADFIQSEETERLLARSEDRLTYTEAAINNGVAPETLNAAALIERWESTVGRIQMNRTLFQGLAGMTDTFGNPVLIPSRPFDEDEGTEQASAIMSEEQGESILKRLVESAELYYDRNPGKFTWARKPSDSVWQALNSFILAATRTDRGDNLMDIIGYEKISTPNVFGLRSQDFWVVKGAPAQAVKHLVEPNFSQLAEDEGKLRYKAANTLLKINRFIKTVNVGFSLFHHFALAESWLADTGATPKSLGRAMQNIIHFRKNYRELMDDTANAASWVSDGLQISTVPMDVDLNLLNRAIRGIAGRFDKNIPWLGNRVRDLGNMKIAFDNFLWHNMLPVMKLQMANEALKSAKHSGAFEGVSKEPLNEDSTEAERIAEAKLREDIAKYINDALGSQEWAQYLWATPYARDLMNTFLFAPDWCSCKDTRAVTKSGPKGYKELAVGDEILGYDKDTGEMRWMPLKDMYVNEDYKGPMVATYQRGSKRKAFVTPHHKCVVEDAKGSRSVKLAGELEAGDAIPRVGWMEHAATPSVDDTLIQLVGWMVTDGSLAHSSWRTKKDGSKVRYTFGRVCQNKTLGVTALQKLGLKYYIEPEGSGTHGAYVSNRPTYRFYVPTPIIKEMDALGVKDNNLTVEFLARLTTPQLELLRDTMMLGDGTGKDRFCGKEEETFNMVLLQLALGLPTTWVQEQENCWRTHTLKTKTLSCANTETELYEGAIWCPSVETGYWMAERDGLIFATGNTISALNISGVPETAMNVAGAKWLGYTPNTGFGTWRRLNRYWPGFFLWIFAAVPSALQAAITLAYGDDDEDDKLFTFQNEKGRRTAIDLTPMLRSIAKDRGILPPTRRSYAQPGKQMREVLHWLTDPVATVFGKSSAAIRVPVAAVTGVIKPSLTLKEVWQARNEADKWAKIAGNLLPFAFTSMSRQEIAGGTVLNTVLGLSMPRVSGMSGMKATQAIEEIVTSFAEDRSVRALAPAVAKAVLEDRVAEVRDQYLRQGVTEKEWEAVIKVGMGLARTPINREIREEWKKGPGKADGGRLKSLLIASNLLYTSNREQVKAIKAGIKLSVSKGEQKRSAPQKMANLEAKLRGANRPELRAAGLAVQQSGSAVSRLNAQKLKRLKRAE